MVIMIIMTGILMITIISMIVTIPIIILLLIIRVAEVLRRIAEICGDCICSPVVTFTLYGHIRTEDFRT